MKKKLQVNYPFLFLSLLIVSILSIFIGVNHISFSNFFQTESIGWKIIMTTRLPRTISLILAGVTLSLSGLLMQQLTQNRFTSPSTVGTMQSARLGLILSLLVFPQSSVISRMFFAFIFAIMGTLIFVGLLYGIRAKSSILVPVIGIMFGNMVSSIGTYLALEWNLVQDVSAWLQGNFSLVHSSNFQLIFLSFVTMLGIISGAHYFSIVGLGKDLVTQLGGAYNRILFAGVILISLGSTAVLLTAGNIPFVGIVIPNLVSLMKGDYFKDNILYVSLCGAIFLVISDILARVIIFPYEIPVSVIVGIIGSCLFIYLLWKGELS